MYQVGDFIIYGNTGVCRVTEITTRDFAKIDKKQLYYALKPLYQECVIYSPVDNTKVFMRPIISAEEARRLIDAIPFITAQEYHSRITRELTDHYEASIGTHDCGDLIELAMSIYAKKQSAQQQNKKIGQVDERYLKRAEELLFGELAAALGIEKESVPDYIAARVRGIG